MATEKSGGIKIHETAEVSPKAKIGDGTSIWNQAQVREEAVIGKNCNIGKDVYIDKGVEIGNNVKIQNGVSVYHGVKVEDNVFLGPHCITTNDLYPRSYSGEFKVTPTTIKKGASVSAGALIICGRTVGEYAMVGAGAVVTRDVPPYGLVVGNPARLLGFVCKCGRKLVFDKDEEDQVLMKCGKCSEVISIPKNDFEKLGPKAKEALKKGE